MEPPPSGTAEAYPRRKPTRRWEASGRSCRGPTGARAACRSERPAIGRALPLTHGLIAIREVIDGASYLQVAPLVGLEIAIGLVYAAVAWLVFRKRLNDTRRTGNMELV